MKLRILSDLHLESTPYYRPSIMKNEKDQILILAGDICEISKIEILKDFLTDMSQRFLQVLYVAGNHEFYHGDINYSFNEIVNVINETWDNVKFLEFDYFNFHDTATDTIIKFIGCTLWTDMDNENPEAKALIKYNLNDYRVISLDGMILQPDDTILLHKQSLNFIKISSIKNENKIKNVVITHHAPSNSSVAPQYYNNPLNPGFISHLDNFIKDVSPDIWVHGHVHNSFNYFIENTNVICNPRGYKNSNNARMLGYGEFENPDFSDQFTIDI